jgi:hypothetical protein
MRRFITMHWLLFFFVAVLTGCAATKQPVTWKPTSDRQIVLDFSYGGAFSPQTRYVADGIRACCEISQPRQRRDGATDYSIKRQLVVFPSPERWRAFWSTIDHLDVTQWKPQYSPEEAGVTVFDGTQWWLSISSLRFTTQSKGDNAYPIIGQPKRTTTDTAAFDELQQAFEALLNTPSA